MRRDDTHEGEAAAAGLACRRSCGRGTVFHARAGNREASARSDSGLRSGLATDLRRPTLPFRSGTAKVVSGA
jgi:hypothetical protein